MLITSKLLLANARAAWQDARVDRDESQRVAELFALHGPAVLRRALRLLGNSADAEEATQEIFIRALRGTEAFQGRSQATTWLYRITTNHCLNRLRDRARRAQLDEAQLPDPDEESRDTNAPADQIALLRRVLAAADPREAQAAIYVYLDGASHDEAAELLSVSKRTVGNLLDRFREAARKLTEGGEA